MQLICIIFHYVITVLRYADTTYLAFCDCLEQSRLRGYKGTQVQAVKGAFLLVHVLVVCEIKYRVPCWLIFVWLYSTCEHFWFVPQNKPPLNHAILRNPPALKICAWGTQRHNSHVCRQDCNKNTIRFGKVVLGQVTISWWGSHRLDWSLFKSKQTIICIEKCYTVEQTNTYEIKIRSVVDYNLPVHF